MLLKSYHITTVLTCSIHVDIYLGVGARQRFGSILLAVDLYEQIVSKIEVLEGCGETAGQGDGRDQVV